MTNYLNCWRLVRFSILPAAILAGLGPSTRRNAASAKQVGLQ